MVLRFAWRQLNAFPAAVCFGVMLAGNAWSVRASAAAPLPAGVQHDVVFTDYSPWSESKELARRMLPPLSFARIQRLLAAKGAALREQPVDLAREKFVVRVPIGAPPAQGYGVLVFVPPWAEAQVPFGWGPVLDRHDLIFVSAANSGNDASVIDRRVPLALLAYANIRRRFALDPARVYVGGMSGGSRVALRIALAFPDVFRGALLNAGSDPIGDREVSLPPADQFRRFQESTRLVYLTGERDQYHLDRDRISERSLQSWCVFDVASEVIPRLGHEIADPAALDRALKALDMPAPVDAGKLAECRARIAGALSAKLADAEAALAHGDRADARAQIEAIDTHYGGLAAPKIVELEDRLVNAK